jgi:hypothetical protein
LNDKVIQNVGKGNSNAMPLDNTIQFNTGGASMGIQLIPFEELCKLIKEQQDMPNVYHVTSTGPHTVELIRDDCDGLEPALQSLGSRCGISLTGLSRMDATLGWLFVTSLTAVS